MSQDLEKTLNLIKEEINEMKHAFNEQLGSLREEVVYLKEMMEAQQIMISDADGYIVKLENTLKRLQKKIKKK